MATPSLREVKRRSNPCIYRLTRSLYSLAMTIICFFILTNSANASANDYCDNAKNNADLINCGHIYYRMEDAALGVIYKNLIEEYKTEDKEYPINGVSRSGSREESLRKAERAWIKFRDKNCEFETLVLGGGGTISGTLHWACLTNLTKKRALELQKLLND